MTSIKRLFSRTLLFASCSQCIPSAARTSDVYFTAVIKVSVFVFFTLGETGGWSSELGLTAVCVWEGSVWYMCV